MPYWIAENFGDCNGWAVIDTAGEAFGCHQTKQGAIDQAIAISLADDEPFMGDWKDENRKVGGTKIKISDIDDTLIHAGQLVQRVYDYLQIVEGELFLVTGRPESRRDDTVKLLDDVGVRYSRLIMNDGSTADSAEYKFETAKQLLETYDIVEAVENDADTRRKYGELGIETVNPSDIGDNRGMSMLVDSVRADSKFETRVQATEFEIRETDEGMTFEGYASVFNSRSENLGGFTEFVAPGAFTRSLKSRNDVKLLWNHDAGQVLGSTRAKSMTLTEDARGLKVSATLPNTQLGRDTAELIRTGIIDSMSFGFNVIKDTWNSEGTERTLDAVRLFEVSIVAFPAYAGTAGTTSVRSVEKLAKRAEVDMSELEAALMKLESGEDLDESSRDLLNSVINKVSPAVTFDPEPEPSEIGDMGLLALKKKKLEIWSM